MYAKLTFNSGTSTAAAIRDIVRLISDSNSGSANLSNLEFVNTSASELVAGVNSGWSVNSAGGTLPSSGTAVGSDDSNYILTGSTLQAVRQSTAEFMRTDNGQTLLLIAVRVSDLQ